MTRSGPPRFAVALMRRFLADNEPLTGDILEGFAVRQSRLWFWRQVLVAVAMRRILPRSPGERVAGEHHARPVNLTASPLPGVGGLGLAAFGVLVALVRPQIWWIFLPAIIGGIALGITMVLMRRRAGSSHPGSANRTLLMEPDPRERTR